MPEDYTLQLALLRETIGLPLEDNNGAVGKVRWWNTHKKLVGAEHWITVATGNISYTPGAHFVNVMQAGALKTPNPSSWCLISGFQRYGKAHTAKILWPPIPFEELLTSCKTPRSGWNTCFQS